MSLEASIQKKSFDRNKTFSSTQSFEKTKHTLILFLHRHCRASKVFLIKSSNPNRPTVAQSTGQIPAIQQSNTPMCPRLTTTRVIIATNKKA